MFKRGDHLYVAALGVDRADALIDYNLANDTHVEVTDGVEQPESLADCAPDVCVLNKRSEFMTGTLRVR